MSAPIDPAAELKAAILLHDISGVSGMLDAHPELLTPRLWPIAMFQADSPAMTRLLLARGLDPDQCSAPRKPLHFAVDKRHPDILEELLQHGANPDIRDGEGFTPLDLCGVLADDKSELFPVCVGILRKAGAEVNVWTSIRIRDTGRALALLEANPGLIHEQSPDMGFLAIHTAARSADVKVVRWLLDHGADVNAANPLDNTALWFVCNSRADLADRFEVAKMLIAAGANLHHPCEDGSTALHFAAWRGPVAIVELLLSYGARASIADKDGKLPVDYASQSTVSADKERIVKLLRETGD